MGSAETVRARSAPSRHSNRKRYANPDAAASGFAYLFRFECREGADLARTVSADPKRTPRSRGQALLHLGSVGTAADVAAASAAFDDDRAFDTSEERTVQVRDVALTVALRLHKREPADFGFATHGANEYKKHQPLGFTTAADRAAAHKKAKEWLAEQRK